MQHGSQPSEPTCAPAQPCSVKVLSRSTSILVLGCYCSITHAALQRRLTVDGLETRQEIGTAKARRAIPPILGAEGNQDFEPCKIEALLVH